MIYILLAATVAAAGARAQGVQLKIETPKAPKGYQVDGKSVTDLEALKAALDGKTVMVCEQYEAVATKSGTARLKKK